MKLRNVPNVFSVLLALFIFVNPVFANGTEVIAKFSKSLSYQELENVVSLFGIEPKELYFEQGDIGGGYTLTPGETISQAMEQLVEKHKEALANILSEIEEEQTTIIQKEKMDSYSVLHKSIVEAIGKTSSQGLKVNGVRVLNTQALQDLLNKGLLESIKPIPKSSREDSKGKLNQKPRPSLFSLMFDFIIPKAHAWHGVYYVDESIWAPRYGSAKTTQYMAFNIFYFNNVSGFDSFGGILTYEHETQVYDKNFADYDGYWSSNMPSKYLDVGIFDPGVDVFTIGTSQASSLVANYQYWTYMSLRPQTSSTAGVIIKGQLGYREPSWCHLPLACIWAAMTTGWLTDYTAPINNQQSWTYNP